MTPLNNEVNDLFNMAEALIRGVLTRPVYWCGGWGRRHSLSTGPLVLHFLSVLCLIQPIECESAASGTPVANL